MTREPSLWAEQARQWSKLTAPLSPSHEDLVWAQETLDGWVRHGDRAPHAVILGATPGLANLRWPESSTIVAVDRSRAVLREVWPSAPSGPVLRSAVEADWLALPFTKQACDLVFGDGVFANLTPGESRCLARSLRHVLGREGRLAVRAFVLPARREAPDAVWEELMTGGIGCFAAFKLRLLMSLCDDDGAVEVRRAWEYFEARGTPAASLAANLGWPADEISTIVVYRDQQYVYWFPTLTWFAEMLGCEFGPVELPRFPTYELGDRCPTFVARPDPLP